MLIDVEVFLMMTMYEVGGNNHFGVKEKAEIGSHEASRTHLPLLTAQRTTIRRSKCLCINRAPDIPSYSLAL